MLNPLPPTGGPAFSAPVPASGAPPETAGPGETFRPSNQDLTRDLQHRIRMAHINHELQRGTAPIQPEETPPQAPPSTTGTIQDAGLNMGVGDMQGPLTPGELWGDYLIPKHNPWR